MRTFLSRSQSFKKPNVPQHNPNPQTIGEHIRKKRIQSKLLQKVAANQLGVEDDTLTSWEMERRQPMMRHYPAIIAFLGYYPFEYETDSLAGKLKQIRHYHGLTFKECAKLLSISIDAAMRWERGKPIANVTYQKLIHSVWSELPQHLLQHSV